MMKRAAYSIFLFLLIQATLFAQNDEAYAPSIDTSIVIEKIEDTVYETETDETSSLKFDTILSTEPFQVRTIPDSTIKRLQKSEEYWYAQMPPPGEKQQQKKKQPTSDWQIPAGIRQLLWFILLSGFIAIIGWFLYTSKAGFFQKKAEDVNDTVAEEVDIHAINFEAEKNKALAEGNYRLATRLWYLQTLKHLTDGGVISYSQDKTNRDYVEQLFGTDYYSSFFQLTRAFEYVWYGQFAVSKEMYEKMAHSFAQFNRKVVA